jgi:hypothetical protein
MARSNVRLDYGELERLKQRLEQIADADEFLTSCAKELAARLLAKVIKRTPVGQYEKGSGKVGGTLRRGWTNGDKSNVNSYANSLNVSKVGNDFVIDIINPVEYASYVEYGHRTRNHKGWVEGHFMLTISEEEIRNSAPKILEKKLKEYLKGCLS